MEKQMKSKVFLPKLLFAAGCMLLLARGMEARAEDGEREARKIVGSWTFEITQQNCETGEPVGKPFLSLLTFGSGGTLVETTENPMFFPAVRGPGHGRWEYDGSRKFHAVFQAFITLNGELAKTQTVRQTLELGDDPNALTTPSASIEFVPADGGPAVTGCATARAKRIQ
jgi:hypothetical protein